MSPKVKFVPNYEIAVGLHKGHKVTKYKPEKVKIFKETLISCAILLLTILIKKQC